MNRPNPFLVILVSSLIAAVTITLLMRPERKRNAARAAQMDKVCQRVKSTLEINEHELRTGGPQRDLIAGRFGQEDRIDSVTLVGLCTGESFNLDVFNACVAKQDYSCLANIMRQTAQRIR